MFFTEPVNENKEFVEEFTSYAVDSKNFSDNVLLSLHIEELKTKFDFETYMQVIVFYCEHSCTEDIEVLAKRLSPSIIESLALEAKAQNMFKDNAPVATLFD